MDNYGRFNADPKVENEIASIEAEFKAAINKTLGRVNALLATEPADTELLHRHAAHLNGMAEEIDRNARRRRDHVARPGRRPLRVG